LHRKCSTAAVVKRLHQCLLQPYPLFRTTATTPALEPRVSPCRKPLAISSQTLAATAGSAAPLQLPATTAASVPLASSCKRRPAMTSQASAATARAAAHLLEADGHHRNTSLLCARCCGGTPRLQRSCPRGSSTAVSALPVSCRETRGFHTRLLALVPRLREGTRRRGPRSALGETVTCLRVPAAPAARARRTPRATQGTTNGSLAPHPVIGETVPCVGPNR